jgi:hypothetical protein
VYNNFDPHASGPVYDWFQARARDVFAAANAVVPPLQNDLAVVLSAVSSYTIAAIDKAGSVRANHAATSQLIINPYYNVHRIDSASTHPCDFADLKAFQGTLLHEGRHAHQNAQSLLGNDADQDYLVDSISVPADGSVPSKDYFLDTTAVRTVCDTALWLPGIPGTGLKQVVYNGRFIPDDFTSVSWALEMDAYTFAANWAK